MRFSKMVARLLLGLIPAACGLAGASCDLVDENHSFDKLTRALVTPHIKWGEPHILGATRVLVVAPSMGQRETVELAQRLEIEFVPLMTGTLEDMHRPSPQYHPHAVPREIVDGVIREKMAGEYDVIIIGKMKWMALPLYFRKWVRERVAGGAGLVYAVYSAVSERDVFGEAVDGGALPEVLVPCRWPLCLWSRKSRAMNCCGAASTGPAGSSS